MDYAAAAAAGQAVSGLWGARRVEKANRKMARRQNALADSYESEARGRYSQMWGIGMNVAQRLQDHYLGGEQIGALKPMGDGDIDRMFDEAIEGERRRSSEFAPTGGERIRYREQLRAMNRNLAAKGMSGSGDAEYARARFNALYEDREYDRIWDKASRRVGLAMSARAREQGIASQGLYGLAGMGMQAAAGMDGAARVAAGLRSGAAGLIGDTAQTRAAGVGGAFNVMAGYGRYRNALAGAEADREMLGELRRGHGALFVDPRMTYAA